MVAAVAQKTRLNTKLDAFSAMNPPKSVKIPRFGIPINPNI